MNIALFADLHGRLLLAFNLCARWQRETGQHIDLILQAGDLNAFPSEERLDYATFKQAKIDPTELGFLLDFMEYDQEVADLLASTTCPLIFVRGNHEDHAWLDDLEEQTPGPLFPVDVYGRVWCLKTGFPYTFSSGGSSLSILGIGRIGAPPSEHNPLKTKYIQPYEQERLLQHLSALPEPLSRSTLTSHQPPLERMAALASKDYQPPPSAPLPTWLHLLLTHDSAQNFIRQGQGMQEIDQVIEHYQPTYHFFGHYGGPARIKSDHYPATLTCKLAELTWNIHAPGHRLASGSMGLLTWHGPTEHHFEVVTTPWLQEYSAHHWKY